MSREVECWSAAGMGTTVLYRGLGKRKALLFDVGRFGAREQLGGAASASHVFISHGHADHCAAAYLHARVRGMKQQKQSQPKSNSSQKQNDSQISTINAITTYYVPEAAVNDFTAAQEAMARLDGGEGIDPNVLQIVGVHPGQEIDLGGDASVVVCKTMHRVPSVGYAVKTKRKELRSELANLSPEEKRKRFQKSPPMPEDFVYRETIEFAYTGDTIIDALDIPEALFLQAATLCMELTFFDGDISFARERGHIHIEELARFAKRGALDNCQALYLMHFSARYKPQFIAETIIAYLPGHLLSIVKLCFDMNPETGEEIWRTALAEKAKII
mmetsp:Transcript_7011/g.14051  ORF Transcript_7011/g.14051 Transcript_7011/m.14051 type:complete len:330 (+) Transcript_7011:162-1151(+)